MSTDDLIERIARALSEHWRDMHTNESLGKQRMLAAAVLPIMEAEVRAAKAEALRDAARYFASGLHCADMRSTPEETVRELNRRATEHETGDQA